jgi:hypothetical protein
MFEGFALGSTKNRRESLKEHAKPFFTQVYLFSGFNLQLMLLFAARDVKNTLAHEFVSGWYYQLGRFAGA